MFGVTRCWAVTTRNILHSDGETVLWLVVARHRTMHCVPTTIEAMWVHFLKKKENNKND